MQLHNAGLSTKNEDKNYMIDLNCFRNTEFSIIIYHQSVNLLEGLIPTKETGGLAGSKHMERLFVFCLMWSLGALLELEDRDKLEAYIRAHDSNIDVPQTKPGETMFEYMVNPNGNCIHQMPPFCCLYVVFK